MTKTYAQVVQEERRLHILRLLSATKPAYQANSTTLRDGLAQLGHTMSRDQMHTELAWLAEMGVCTLETPGSVIIVTLTARGLDVAEGTAQVPGIKRHTAID